MKKPSLFQTLFERPQIRPLFEMARAEFVKIDGDLRPYFFMMDEEFFGIGKFEMPVWFNDSISKGWANK